MADTQTNPPVTDTDPFEIGLRFMDRGLIGLRLTSRSKMRNWMVISMICLVMLTGVFIEAAPVIQQVVKGLSQ